jgi:hypothetical protein
MSSEEQEFRMYTDFTLLTVQPIPLRRSGWKFANTRRKKQTCLQASLKIPAP